MAEETQKKGWFQRLRDGLSRSSDKMSEGISALFGSLTRRKLDETVLEELEDLLILGDLGPSTAAKLVDELRQSRLGKEVSAEELRLYLARRIAEMLAPVAQPLAIRRDARPYVLLMVGVNGSGKTTTMGKLAHQLVQSGKRVMLVAGDTFRAAAVGQLQIWGERAGCEVVSGREGADAAGLAYDALQRARAEGADVLMIDTAGRLQNKANLMDELKKIGRVLKNLDPDCPHATLLVLDATTGQNAFAQVEVFKDMTHVTGLVLTKLDGSAKGGVLVGLAERFGLPVHAIGVGEQLGDLRPFTPEDFAASLMSVSREAMEENGAVV